MVCDDPETFSLSQNKLDEIEELRYQLSERRSATMKKKGTLLARITTLWNRLAIDSNIQEDIKRRCTGIKSNDIQLLEQVFNLLSIRVSKT